jgi:hypothetical protein
MTNLSKYTDYALRKPPKNVKVMMIFRDDSKDVCYIDDWGIIHGEQTRIIKGRVPAYWKKIEKDMGEYIW